MYLECHDYNSLTSSKSHIHNISKSRVSHLYHLVNTMINLNSNFYCDQFPYVTSNISHSNFNSLLLNLIILCRRPILSGLLCFLIFIGPWAHLCQRFEFGSRTYPVRLVIYFIESLSLFILNFVSCKFSFRV